KEGGKDGRILGPESQKPDTGWIAFTRSSQINDDIVVAVNPILSDRGIKITSNQTVQYLNTTYKADLPSSHPRIVSDMNVVKTYELMDGGGDVLAVFNELNADSPSGEYRAIYSASYHVDGLPTFHTITSERYVYIDEPIEVIEVEPKDANKQLAFFKQLFDTASRLSNRKESFDKEENTLRRASMGLDTVADIIDLTDRDENIVFVRTNRLILAIHDEDEKEILDLLKIKQKGKKIEYMGIPELDINQQIKLSENNPGYTALMMCAMLGDKKTVEYLLGFSQLDIDATSDQGTARDIAESLGHTDIVEILELESMKRKIYRRN
ncbi:ankyrin repeat domain-containing protein, partial [Chlamydiia bacterium]|nr:ankyrin repeat domain-containing protein [Chlamydiia bacterium]